ncbi:MULTISPECIES: SDR family NAD(P)-dependent oxidoreductase [unclassified Rhizobacter]|uniref:SDR family NAD(P)-dependent oxidoreductase n=1 Tax=unclassified Rhizobacter TaxID=2640088 RepID=UPI0006FAA6EF|nr:MULTISPECIES: SDR family NAD(P)-dependent oxidoreductase [unclassified Rhizobacter]KQU73647.1 short-chain dehydrogenase [Rhizobacter sp. Root29]KQW08913.1 short-chain dehydrogenase [Rhizobacter sp. Root1238]KRB21590.1 short-chain dehydrogenase [Rhizobacter sp. Root16D2]
MKRIVIVGATSGIAQHCARLWAEAGPVHLTLLARDAARTETVAADLRVRSPASTLRVAVCDFLEPSAIARAVDDAVADGVPDIVLIAHGSLPDQAGCQSDLGANLEALQVNGVSPVLFAEAFVAPMLRAGRGTVALIGSVAGDRGRKSNYVYGAAKGLVTRYAQGLQHRLAATAVRVVLVKPGPTDTPMTAALRAKGAKLADPRAVAARILRGIDAGSPVVYAPGKWALIMMVIRHLPRAVFNRMDI